VKFNFSWLRTAFHSWPNELDVAKCETNWAAMAQEFYCAASVLHDEMRAVKNTMHSGESLDMTESVLKRIHTSRPALFCMAFALELAAKAATVRNTRGAGIEHGQRLSFAGHGVDTLCDQMPELDLSESERTCLKQAAEIIVNGKYPTDIKPRDDKSSFIAPSFEDFMSVALSIYEKLMELATAAQPVAPGDAPQAARS
jgi:hypothetical protein